MGCCLSREQSDLNQEPISDFVGRTVHSVKFRDNEGQQEVAKAQIFALTNLSKGQSEFMHNIGQRLTTRRENGEAQGNPEVFKWFKGESGESSSILEFSSDNNTFDYGSGPEIVDLQETLTKNLRVDLNLKSAECQTDPVKDEAFDWDLSDKTDCETQTVPPTKANSPFGVFIDALQDAIVQTDQRLVFLLHKAAAEKLRWQLGSANQVDVRINSRKDADKHNTQQPSLTDAWVQTYVEVHEIGIQVEPEDFLTGSKKSGYRRSDSGGMHPSRQSSHSKHPTEIETEDDGFASYGDENADIATIHMSATSARHQPMRNQNRKKRREGFVSARPKSTDHEDSESGEDQIFTSISKSRSGTVYKPESEQEIQLDHEPHTPEAALTRQSSRSMRLSVNENPDIENNLNGRVPRPHLLSAGAILSAKKVDVGVQTDKDVMTEELRVGRNENRRTRVLRKYELIGDSPTLFHHIDEWVVEISKKRYKSLRHIVRLLVNRVEEYQYHRTGEELLKVRAFFRWCTENIRYDMSCAERDMTTKDILREKTGVCRQYVKIFSEMCSIAGIRVKNIKGYVRGFVQHAGNKGYNVSGSEPNHSWNAVFVGGTWRLVDCTWGAGQFDVKNNCFEKKLNEHFFLTDPDELIYTHFPHDEAEDGYDCWQLLDELVSFESFNSLPLLTGMFFEYSLRLDPELELPIVITDQSEINIWAWEPIHYRYKFFPANKPESEIFNCNVLCYLKGRSRKLGYFKVMPPDVGQYFLKIYAKPEEEITPEDESLDHVATILIQVLQVKNKPNPYPRNEQTWGVTKSFFDTDIVLPRGLFLNPIVNIVGEQKKKVVLKTPRAQILSVSHIYDADGNELVQDKDRDVKYTVLLNRKNPLPSSNHEEGEESSTLLPFISKKATTDETTFVIDTPPKVGFYKLQIFGVKRPKKPGKLKIPLIMSLLVDYRHSVGPIQTAASTATVGIVKGAAERLLALTATTPLAPSSVLSANAPQAMRPALKAASKFSKNLLVQRSTITNSKREERPPSSGSLHSKGRVAEVTSISRPSQTSSDSLSIKIRNSVNIIAAADCNEDRGSHTLSSVHV